MKLTTSFRLLSYKFIFDKALREMLINLSHY